MVMKAEPVFEAVESVSRQGVSDDEQPYIILMSPQGRLFNQAVAAELSRRTWLMFICGHYEGIDERIRQHLAQDEISIGDYVLTGGELAAMVISDAVVRLIPGVLGSGESLLYESHTAGLLEYPQYSRPEVFRNWSVPEVLLSGNHAEIAKWRRAQSIRRTAERRPDMLERADLSPAEKEQLSD